MIKNLRLLLISMLLFLSAGMNTADAQSLSTLKFKDYSIESFSPSFTSLSGAVAIQLENLGPAYKMKNIRVQVYKQGVPFVKANINDIALVKGAQTIHVSGTSTICEGVSFWTLLSCLSFSLEQYTMDVKLTLVTNQGVSVPIEKKNVSVSNLLNNKLRGATSQK